MPSKNEDLSSELPKSINPYEVLSVASDATDDQIKKAYRKAALKHHPDKATDEEAKATAHEAFQNVAFAYAILSEPGRRARYDSTGSTSEAVDLEDGSFDWTSFYRERYDEITIDSIKQFSDNYKGKEEERASLINAYTKYKGDMGRIYETVILSNVLHDDERYRGILDAAIEKGEIESFDKYTKEPQASKERRVKKAKREAKDAEEALKEAEEKGTKKNGKSNSKKNDSMADLAALIRKKKGGGNFLDALEAKYAATARKGKRGAPTEEPSEEAFQAIRAKLETDSGARRSKRTKS